MDHCSHGHSLLRSPSHLSRTSSPSAMGRVVFAWQVRFTVPHPPLSAAGIVCVYVKSLCAGYSCMKLKGRKKCAIPSNVNEKMLLDNAPKALRPPPVA